MVTERSCLYSLLLGNNVCRLHEMNSHFSFLQFVGWELDRVPLGSLSHARPPLQ